MDEKPGFRIETVTLFTQIGDDNEEGVCAFLAPHGWMPMVATDEERVEQLYKHARAIVHMNGTPIMVKRFTTMTEVDVIVRHEDVE